MHDSIEPETIVQLSLHTISEYVDIVLSEAEARDIVVDDLRKKYNDDPEGEFINEIADEALSRLLDAGYDSVEADDILLIWRSI